MAHQQGSTQQQPQNHVQQQPLKRLHVVQQAGTLAYTTGEQFYKHLRSWAPPLANPGLERLETVASSVVPGVSQAAEQLLRAADERVDILLANAHNSEVSRRLRVDQLLTALSAGKCSASALFCRDGASRTCTRALVTWTCPAAAARHLLPVT